MFEECFTGISWMLKGFFRKLQGCFKHASKVLKEKFSEVFKSCFKGVPIVFQRHFQEVSRVSQKSVNRISKKFKKGFQCFSQISWVLGNPRMIQRTFNGVLCNFALLSSSWQVQCQSSWNYWNVLSVWHVLVLHLVVPVHVLSWLKLWEEDMMWKMFSSGKFNVPYLTNNSSVGDMVMLLRGGVMIEKRIFFGRNGQI